MSDESQAYHSRFPVLKPASGPCSATSRPSSGWCFPFGNVLGPLIVWQVKKDLDPFVDAQGKEALNFQISVALAALLCFLLMVGDCRLPAAGAGQHRGAGAHHHCRDQGQ